MENQWLVRAIRQAGVGEDVEVDLLGLVERIDDRGDCEGGDGFYCSLSNML